MTTNSSATSLKILHASDDLTVPRILHHSAAQVVVQFCLKQPSPIPLIVTPRSLQYGVPGHSKLCATGRSHNIRYRKPREQYLESLFVVSPSPHALELGISNGLSMVFLLHGMYFGRTAYSPHTSQVHAPLLLYVWHLQSLKHPLAVVQWIIVVPLVPLSMQEDANGRKVVVVVDDVGEVGHCFTAFVHWHCQGRVWRIRDVNLLVPCRKGGGKPRRIVCCLTCYNQGHFRPTRNDRILRRSVQTQGWRCDNGMV